MPEPMKYQIDVGPEKELAELINEVSAFILHMVPGETLTVARKIDGNWRVVLEGPRREEEVEDQLVVFEGQALRENRRKGAQD